MTKLLEKAIEKLRQLPSDRQDEAAELVLEIVEQDPRSLRLSPEQVAEVERRLKEPTGTVEHADVRVFFQKRAG